MNNYKFNRELEKLEGREKKRLPKLFYAKDYTFPLITNSWFQYKKKEEL